MLIPGRSGIAGGLGLAAMLLCSACFTRDEAIVVRPDGSASVTVTMEGDEQDFLTGEALSPPAGWETDSSSSVDHNGRRQIKSVWRAVLRDLNRYPASFNDPSDPHAASGLRFATSLAVEPQPDRIVYRFTRRFEGRHAGLYRKMREESLPPELEAKEEADLTPEDREKLLEGAGRYEALSRLLRARNVLGRAAAEGLIDPSVQQEILEDLHGHLEDRLSLASMRRIFALPDDQQEQEARRLSQDVRSRVEGSAVAGSLQRLRFLLDREERDFEVMQDISDDRMILGVELPGTIVEANTPMVKGSQASWDVPGEEIIDGDVVLTAVSVLMRDPSGK